MRNARIRPIVASAATAAVAFALSATAAPRLVGAQDSTMRSTTTTTTTPRDDDRDEHRDYGWVGLLGLLGLAGLRKRDRVEHVERVERVDPATGRPIDTTRRP